MHIETNVAGNNKRNNKNVTYVLIYIAFRKS